MKKYLLPIFIAFSFVLVCFFVFVPQQIMTYAAKVGDTCTGNGHGSCGNQLYCNPPPASAAQGCAHGVQADCQSKCALPTSGQVCTGAGDCQGGLTCQSTGNLTSSQQVECIRAIAAKQTPPSFCEKTCSKAAPPPGGVGDKCTGTPGQGTCAGGLVCYTGKCQTPDQLGDACTFQVNGSDQGSCADGLKCQLPNANPNQNPHQNSPPCNLHTSANCGGTQQGKTVGGGHCVNPAQNPGTFVADTPLPPPPSPPCKTWGNGICSAFGSTFGGFSTNPGGFIEKVFAVLLSVSGGIALLLIIKAGYQLMTAQGNPEKLNNGREQLVAAIVGLVFLIFSFVFLQLIGFDILHLPGFTGGTGANQPGKGPNPNLGQGAPCNVNMDLCKPPFTCTSTGFGNGLTGTCQ